MAVRFLRVFYSDIRLLFIIIKNNLSFKFALYEYNSFWVLFKELKKHKNHINF